MHEAKDISLDISRPMIFCASQFLSEKHHHNLGLKVRPDSPASFYGKKFMACSVDLVHWDVLGGWW